MLGSNAAAALPREEAPREWILEQSEFALGSEVNENDRLTPKWLADKVREFSPVKLDPASNAGSFINAEESWSAGALQRSWRGYGTVFCNPPYHKKEEPLSDWLTYAATQFNWVSRKGSKDELLFLMPSRTEAVYFRKFGIDACDAVLFFTGRLAHPLPGGLKATGGGRFGSVLLYFGYREEEFLQHFSDHGWGYGFDRDGSAAKRAEKAAKASKKGQAEKAAATEGSQDSESSDD